MRATPVPVEMDDAIDAAGTSSIVGYRLRRAQLKVFQRFLAAFEALNLRPAEYSVLVLIADNPGRKQTAIAEVLGIKRANFVALVHEMEERGLVERRPAADDKRANALHLTRAGKTFLTRARAVHDEMEQALVERLGGPKGRDALLALLDRLM
jgi:DNA-binding MarR family transcriptional regulator